MFSHDLRNILFCTSSVASSNSSVQLPLLRANPIQLVEPSQVWGRFKFSSWLCIHHLGLHTQSPWGMGWKESWTTIFNQLSAFNLLSVDWALPDKNIVLMNQTSQQNETVQILPLSSLYERPLSSLDWPIAFGLMGSFFMRSCWGRSGLALSLVLQEWPGMGRGASILVDCECLAFNISLFWWSTCCKRKM